MAIVKIKEPSGFSIEYFMDDRLKKNVDEKVIPALSTQDKDYVICVDGREGSGKSWFSFQLGKAVDPSLNIKRIVFSPDDFREAILSAKKGQCIIYDEAFTGFSSRSSLSPVNRVLVSLSMQMRQKNLFIIIVLPTIFLLDKYMAMFRTKGLFHVFESKGRRGYFKFYNSRIKKYLILAGQKTMSYNHKKIWTRFKGRFYGKFALGDDKVLKEYLKKKERALADSEKTSMTSAQVKFKEQRNLLLFLIRKQMKLSYREMSELLNDYDMALSYVQLRSICAKFGDTETEIDKKAKKEEENSNLIENSKENDEKELNSMVNSKI